MCKIPKFTKQRDVARVYKPDRGGPRAAKLEGEEARRVDPGTPHQGTKEERGMTTSVAGGKLQRGTTNQEKNIIVKDNSGGRKKVQTLCGDGEEVGM